MKKILFLLLFSAVIVGCGRSSQDYEQWHDSSGILRFIPADSPLIGVRLAPFPLEFRERFDAQNALVGRANRDAWQALVGSAALHEAEADAFAMQEAFRWFDGLINSEAAADAGISPDAPAALYWVGTQPVLRIALLDQTAFEQFATEQLRSEAMTIAVLSGKDVRYFAFQGPRLALLVDAGFAVLTLAPEGGSETELAAQLGLTPPALDVAASGLLGDIAETHGMTGSQLVYLQPVGLFDALNAPGGLKTQLLAELTDVAGNPLDAIPADCQSDIKRWYSSVEAVTLGFSEVGATGLKGVLAVNLSPLIARDLENLARPVPGLGAPTDALLSFGLSLNAKVLRRFVENRVTSILDEPFQCAAMERVNQQAARLAVILDKQPTPPTAREFRGLVVSADWPEEALKTGPSAWMNARLQWILATDKPESLVAFGNFMLPPLAALNLRPDGTIVDVPQGLLNPTGQPMVVAMTDDRLIGAVGPGGEARLEALRGLKAASKEAAPLFAMSVDAAALLDVADGLGAATPDQVDLLSEMKSLYARQSLVVRTTSEGVRIDFELGLRKEAK